MKKAKTRLRANTKGLKSFSLDELLTETYGPKESVSRKAAESKISLIAKKLVLSNTLKELRELKNRLQKEVAEKMNVDDSVVSKLEKNFEKAQVDTILRYAKALQAKRVSLVFEFDNKISRMLNLTD